MKNKTTVLLAFFSLILVPLVSTGYARETGENPSKGTPSKIVHVIVYPEWAYVTRMAEVSLNSGTVTYTFNNLPAWIDEDSIRVKIESSHKYSIVGTSTHTIYLAKSGKKEVQKATDEVQKLQYANEDIQGELEVLEEEKKYLRGLTTWKLDKIPREGAIRKVDTAELKGVKDFITRELLTNITKTNQLERKIRALEPRIRAKQKELERLQSRERLEKKQIRVEVKSPGTGKAKLRFSYLINGASWYPSYDARTEDGNQQLNFSYSAIVQQSTGEDWSDATFTLSTIQPYKTRRKPELKPWYITSSNAGGVNRIPVSQHANVSRDKEYRDKMKRIQEKHKMSNTYIIEDQISYQNVQSNLAKAREVVRRVEERGTTVEFDITGKYKVAANGRPVKLSIGAANIGMALRYLSVPSVSKNTYIVAKVRNNSNFPFLPGPVKIYVGGSFIGKSKIDSVAEGESFELYLGLEERIKVTRRLDYKKSNNATAGGKVKMKVGYTIDVKNFLEKPASVEVFDQVPVSQENAVKVKALEIKPEATRVKDGIIQWMVHTNRDSTRSLYFEYRLEYPQTLQLRENKKLRRVLEDFSLEELKK
ncbi:MAG: mucoidy inhibitor MuiA family protein [bacterium]|nr:mucoidy inhibitor MuiA family protein [bacterium]